jgi:hypothetical protein
VLSQDLGGERGDRIWKVFRWFVSNVISGNQNAKTQMLDGDVVLRVRRHGLAPDGLDPLGVDGGLLVCDRFLHVSLLYLSPVMPTFRRLIWPDQCVDDLGNLHLKATDEYATLFEFLSSVIDDDNCQFHVEQFRVRISSVPLDAIQPRLVHVHTTGNTFICNDAPKTSRPKKAKLDDNLELEWADTLNGLECLVDSDTDSVCAFDFADFDSAGSHDAHDGSSFPVVGSHEKYEPVYSPETPNQGSELFPDGGVLSCVESILDHKHDDTSFLSESFGEDLFDFNAPLEVPHHISPPASPIPAAGKPVELPGPQVPPVPSSAGSCVPSAVGKSRAGDRSFADVFHVEGGFLKFYGGARMEMVAHCAVHGINGCRLTRITRASPMLARAGQGKPIGLLCAWLKAPETHMPKGVRLPTPVPCLAERQAARAAFEHLPGSHLFTLHERPCRAEEPNEPINIP